MPYQGYMSLSVEQVIYVLHALQVSHKPLTYPHTCKAFFLHLKIALFSLSECLEADGDWPETIPLLLRQSSSQAPMTTVGLVNS